MPATSTQRRLAAAWAVLALGLGAASAADTSPDVVRVSGGLVEGVRNATGGFSFWRGVPFAETTAGANRFAAPVPKATWNGTLNATAYGHGCWSDRHNPDAAQDPSEDCLNMNIYAPASHKPGDALAVQIALYGGSFLEGDNIGAFGMYDASYIAAKHNVIVVEPNYVSTLDTHTHTHTHIATTRRPAPASRLCALADTAETRVAAPSHARQLSRSGSASLDSSSPTTSTETLASWTSSWPCAGCRKTSGRLAVTLDASQSGGRVPVACRRAYTSFRR